MTARSVALAILVAALLVAAGAPASATPDANESATPVCAGVVDAPAAGTTVVSVQGMRFGEDGGKRRARIVAFHPNGSIAWVHRNGEELGVSWSYDVDPMENGNVFVTATTRRETLLYELDGDTGDVRWTEAVPLLDTHDADRLGDGRIVIANMRNYDEDAGVSDDRVIVYDRRTDSVAWEWRFAEHFDRDVGGNYTEDWTHLNDVDVVGEDRLLLSPRNFDQVLLVNRTTGDVVWTLGADDQFDTLRKQHNPDYLESEDGTPTVLVADSENDRVVEYAREDGEWTRTWTVGNRSVLRWPRDADRLPSGNTLISDSINNRVVEVTPEGEVVWEVYAPWLVYDAARLEAGEHGGPTATDLNVTGEQQLRNATPPSTAEMEACAAAIDDYENEQWATPTPTAATAAATTSGDATDDESALGGETRSRSESTGASAVEIPGFTPTASVAAVAAVALAGLLATRRRRRE